MRIAVVTSSYPAHEGDPSGHFVRAEVAELERQGHEVVLVKPEAGGAFGWPGVASRVRERPHRAFEAATWVGRATLALRAARPDRIVAHWAVPAAWPIALASDRAELEIVSHGADVRLLRKMPASLRSTIVRSLVVRASCWRFVSEELRHDLETVLAPADAAAVRAISAIAPSPLGMLDVTADIRARRSEIGERRLYVCAGRLVPSKRVHRVIDYVASEQTQEGRLLVVLGDGPERENLESVARGWQLDVRFLGTTTRREALGWIGAADEVVHASRAEGLSTVVREARELGIPVTILP